MTIILAVALSLFNVQSCQNNNKNLFDKDNETDSSEWMPQNFTVKQISLAVKELHWNYGKWEISGFIIDRKEGNEEWQNKIAILPKNIHTWKDTVPAKNSDSVYYRIYAYADERKSTCAETSVPRIDEPANVSITINSKKSLTLKWDYSMLADNGFIIDRKIDDGEWIISWAHVASNKTTYTDATVNVYKQIISYRLYASCSGLYSQSVETVMPAGIEMIFVEGGNFIRGCRPNEERDCAENEKPAHKVKLSDYYIGKYEITQMQWEKIMGSNPSVFNKCEECPVEWVSWDDCQLFIEKLNQMTGKQFRLPTEAEWEYAARGGKKSKGYKFSGSNNLNDVAWYFQTGGGETYPVGTKLPNELGIYDMSGNVFEWCNDRYENYKSEGYINPCGPEKGVYRIYRGGRSLDYVNGYRLSFRAFNTPDYKYYFLGLRLVHN